MSKSFRKIECMSKPNEDNRENEAKQNQVKEFLKTLES